MDKLIITNFTIKLTRDFKVVHNITTTHIKEPRVYNSVKSCIKIQYKFDELLEEFEAIFRNETGLVKSYK